MTMQSLLADQLSGTHHMLEGAMENVTPEQMTHKGDGWTIQSIGAIYAHAILVEDKFISLFATDSPTLFERDGWAAKTGLTESTSVDSVQAALDGLNFDGIKAYAQAVYANTDEAIKALSDADLERLVQFGNRPEQPLARFLGTVALWHYQQHAGEICALIGVQGGKGLPF